MLTNGQNGINGNCMLTSSSNKSSIRSQESQTTSCDTIITLSHIQAYDVARSKFFDNVSSYDQLISSIDEYGKNGSKETPEDRLGYAWEVFSEFFLRRYGAEVSIGVHDLKDTSKNKYNPGIDFEYVDSFGKPGGIQCKYKSNGTYQFTQKDLMTAVNESYRRGINVLGEQTRLILFTNTYVAKAFHTYYDVQGPEEFRVFNRVMQEKLINIDPKFWPDFVRSLARAGGALPEIAQSPTMRPHQQEAFNACTNILDSADNHRGKAIMVCGGGKTLVQYELIRRSFDKGSKVQVIVTPRIALSQQHAETFSGWGLYTRDAVKRFDFMSGEDQKLNPIEESVKTTDPSAFVKMMNVWRENNILIHVTYASYNKLETVLKNAGIQVDVTYFDEYHHLVSQSLSQKDVIHSLHAKKNLFFSASEKRGNIVSSYDTSLFGQKLIDVTYNDLRSVGILVPKINVVLIREAAVKARKIKPSIGEDIAAKEKGLDLNVALEEAAANILAWKDLHNRTGRANVLAYTQSVNVIEFLKTCRSFIDEFPTGTLVNSVVGGTKQDQRLKIFKEVKTAPLSLLMNHSVIGEGIDLTAFEAIVIHRGMSVISLQQALGRAIRAQRVDTENLVSGKITLDSQAGWEKYTATVYLAVSEDDEKFMSDLIEKLSEAGLSADDVQFQEIIDQRSGVLPEDNAWQVSANTSFTLTRENIQSQIARLYLERKQRELDEIERIRCENMSVNELIDELFGPAID